MGSPLGAALKAANITGASPAPGIAYLVGGDIRLRRR